MEAVRAEEDLLKKARAGQLTEKKAVKAEVLSPKARRFHVMVDQEFFEVGVEEVAGVPSVQYVTPAARPAEDVSPLAAQAAAAKAPLPEGKAVKAPMPGMIVRIEQKVGDAVKQGETLMILEAMKMENAILSSADGIVKSINCSVGDIVSRDQLLCIIGQA